MECNWTNFACFMESDDWSGSFTDTFFTSAKVPLQADATFFAAPSEFSNPQSLSDSSWLSTTGCAIRNNVTFDFQPTNPQTDIMPTWQCEIIVRTVDLMKEIQQRDPTDQATVPTHMPQVFTCEAACIYNTNGKCIGMVTTERLQTLLEAYEAAKKAGMHATIQPHVQESATEIMGLLSRQKAQQKYLSAKSKKLYNYNTLITLSHIRSALHK
eukprot:1143620-Pelagomonas_calceolata.AAC.2